MICFAFFGMSHLVVGQTYLDTLLQTWLDTTENHTIRVESYLDYIYDYFILQRPNLATPALEEITAFAFENDLDSMLPEIKRYHGYHFFRTGQYIDALRLYEEGIAHALALSDTFNLANIILRKGWLYHDNGQRIKAVNHYRQSLELFEKTHDLLGMSSVYNELGSIYREEENWSKAQEYYEKSLEVRRQHDPQSISWAVMSNMSDVYSALEKYDTALLYAHRSLQNSLTEHNQLAVASDLSVVGGIYLSMNMVDSASHYLQRSLDVGRAINDVQRMTVALLELGFIDIESGASSAAIQKCTEALTLAEEIQDLNDQQSACECLYEAYKDLGNQAEALLFFERSTELADSLLLRETTVHLQEMEFRALLQEDSIKQAQASQRMTQSHQLEISKKERNRNVAIVGGLFFFLTAVGLYRRARSLSQSRRQIQKEKEESESLLHNILPAEIAEELKAKGEAKAKTFQNVSILFTDFKNFTAHSPKVSPEELVSEINECFKAFDGIIEEYGIEKIKTIGDAYMAAGGLPSESTNAVAATVLAALKMQDFIKSRRAQGLGKIPFEMRLGIHTGPITAGIVGVKKFQYDVWGDTVNTASRMESSGAINRVNISADTYQRIANDARFRFEPRGEIEAKGKGMMKMYFVSQAEAPPEP